MRALTVMIGRMWCSTYSVPGVILGPAKANQRRELEGEEFVDIQCAGLECS